MTKQQDVNEENPTHEGSNRVAILQRFCTGRAISFDEWESTAAASDDDLAAAFRDPNKWSYVVRDPVGRIAVYGKADTRIECEHWALSNAEDYVIDSGMTYSELGLDGNWHFVLWPPVGTGA